MASRSKLRTHFRRARRRLTRAEQTQHAHAVTRHLLSSGLLLNSHRIGGYWPADGELDIRPVMHQLTTLGKVLALPVIRHRPNQGRSPSHSPSHSASDSASRSENRSANRSQTHLANHLTFCRYRPGDPLVENRFRILEPLPNAARISGITLNTLLVPLVAFDEDGVRLGMGGGYYDRFVDQLTPGLRPRMVGMAHELQRSPRPLPRERWDVPLAGVITEAGWQTFDSSENTKMRAPDDR